MRSLYFSNSIFIDYRNAPTDLSKVIKRKFINFLCGDGPDWCYIRSKQLKKTHHYNEIANLIASGRNVMVVGIAASGKTTLMMQLVDEFKVSKYKHFIFSPTFRQVQAYLKEVGCHKCILFLDNSLRDYRIVNLVLKKPNIQLVCFERDFSYEAQAYRINNEKNTFAVYDVTEINDIDIQSIKESIPRQYRKNAKKKLNDKTIFNVLSCFYELSINKFIKRFKESVNSLYKENPLATELFIMICYVHSCGVPVSMDMLFSYIIDEVGTYEDIYKLLGEVGKIIIECSDSEMYQYLNYTNYCNQDYYKSRSQYFAELILRELPNRELLKKVMIKFVDNINPASIVRFDVFKRRAYDSAVVKRAFDNIDEGEEFYKACRQMDNSEYVYQQAAIYFSDKGDYDRAFVWIDMAESLEGINKFSIRNTAAIILFDANINIKSETKEYILTEALNTLESCYTVDRRKYVHVMAFVDRAIKFYDMYGFTKAERYLLLGSEWLKTELSGNYHSRRNHCNLARLSQRLNKIIDLNTYSNKLL